MNPIAFHVFGRPIYWYGIFVALGFLAGITHWNLRAPREGWPREIGSDLGLWIMIGGILGARLAYVLANWSDYAAAPWTIFRIDQGGLIYYGGFVGGAVAVTLFSRQRRRPLLEVADFTIGAVPLGHFFGRIGCFINGCCYGAPAQGPLACAYPFDGVPRHPVQLYEAIGNLGIYFLLLRVPPRRAGDRLALYLLLYPAWRFMMEFLRGDARWRWGGLTMAQLLSAALFLAGLALLYRPLDTPLKGEP